MSNYMSVLELQKEGRLSEAGYGRLFAWKSTRFNAMIDVRTKAKYIRELNPDTYETTQNGLLYAGPTVFHNPIDIKNHMIDKIDLKSAYLSYLVNSRIKKPGLFRIKHEYALPISARVVLYVVEFNVSIHNDFVKWYLNSSAIQKKRIKTDGVRVWGQISIFASTWFNQMKYIDMFLDKNEGKIVRCYTFHGSSAVDTKNTQILKLFAMKEAGNKDAKSMLVQSTGWLSLIDKPTYYHMIQYIKFYLMETVYNYGLQDDNVGVQTDGFFVRVNERTAPLLEELRNADLSLSELDSTIGTYTFERVHADDIITNKARVILRG